MKFPFHAYEIYFNAYEIFHLCKGLAFLSKFKGFQHVFYSFSGSKNYPRTFDSGSVYLSRRGPAFAANANPQAAKFAKAYYLAISQ